MDVSLEIKFCDNLSSLRFSLAAEYFVHVLFLHMFSCSKAAQESSCLTGGNVCWVPWKNLSIGLYCRHLKQKLNGIYVIQVCSAVVEACVCEALELIPSTKNVQFIDVYVPINFSLEFKVFLVLMQSTEFKIIYI